MLHKIITAFLILIPLTYFLILTNPAPMSNQVTLPTATTLEEESTEPQGFAPLSAEEQKRIQNFMWNSSPKPAPLGQAEIINLIALSLLPFVYFFGIRYIDKSKTEKDQNAKNAATKETKKNKKTPKSTNKENKSKANKKKNNKKKKKG